MLAAVVAALGVPVGYALSIDSAPKAQRTRYAAAIPAATVVGSPVVMPRGAGALPNEVLSPVADSARLLFIGSILFGLAAAVRKTI